MIILPHCQPTTSRHRPAYQTIRCPSTSLGILTGKTLQDQPSRTFPLRHVVVVFCHYYLSLMLVPVEIGLHPVRKELRGGGVIPQIGPIGRNSVEWVHRIRIQGRDEDIVEDLGLQGNSGGIDLRMMRKLIQVKLENILAGQQMSRLIDHPERYCQNAGNEEHDSILHPSFQALSHNTLQAYVIHFWDIGKTCAPIHRSNKISRPKFEFGD